MRIFVSYPPNFPTVLVLTFTERTRDIYEYVASASRAGEQSGSQEHRQPSRRHREGVLGSPKLMANRTEVGVYEVRGPSAPLCPAHIIPVGDNHS